MRRAMKAFMISLVILSVAFSGCVTTGDGNSDDGTSGMPTDDDFQGLDYIECMEHEDMERCWNVFVQDGRSVSRRSDGNRFAW